MASSTMPGFQNGRFAQDWADVPNYLTEGWRDWATVGWIMAALWTTNGAMLLIIRSHLPKDTGPQNIENNADDRPTGGFPVIRHEQ